MEFSSLAPNARAFGANCSKRSESGERSPEGAPSRVSSPEGAASRVPREARDEPKAKSQATAAAASAEGASLQSEPLEAKREW